MARTPKDLERTLKDLREIRTRSVYELATDRGRSDDDLFWYLAQLQAVITAVEGVIASADPEPETVKDNPV